MKEGRKEAHNKAIKAIWHTHARARASFHIENIAKVIIPAPPPSHSTTITALYNCCTYLPIQEVTIMVCVDAQVVVDVGFEKVKAACQQEKETVSSFLKI